MKIRDKANFELLPILEDEWTDEVVASFQFKDMDSTVLDQIRLNAETYYFQMMVDCKTSKEAFNKLKTHFKGSQAVKSLRTLNSLIDNVNNKSDDLDEVLVKFKNVYLDLKSMYSGLPDGVMVSFLLCSLPTKYDYLVKQVV